MLYGAGITRAFQSTLPTRGSDKGVGHFLWQTYAISIHAPHEGERLNVLYGAGITRAFQSTLPTRGSDCPISSSIACRTIFHSTLPTRGSDPAICGF